MKAHMGDGYVDSYYEELAQPFIRVALAVYQMDRAK